MSSFIQNIYMQTVLLIVLLIFTINLQAAPKELMVYIGTYTRAEEQGIHWLRLDLGTGKLSEVGKGKKSVFYCDSV